MTEIIIILNKNGDILDFSPRNIDIREISKLKQEEVYDDGELIRIKAIV
ncbi:MULTISPECIES: hypothetical protein [unclassified Stygiolobus]|nr:hypothetical protein [Sulfolobaceae archaeon]